MNRTTRKRPGPAPAGPGGTGQAWLDQAQASAGARTAHRGCGATGHDHPGLPVRKHGGPPR
ncbi:hypothetical protein ACIBBD_24600 [Streptomyces sp. NPDC051315]|uniref:hypothetical protein n=1 Tax=Streptomyces sp. NPDC051315 TaxID=3365650 RepID=UPI003789D4D3